MGRNGRQGTGISERSIRIIQILTIIGSTPFLFNAPVTACIVVITVSALHIAAYSGNSSGILKKKADYFTILRFILGSAGLMTGLIFSGTVNPWLPFSFFAAGGVTDLIDGIAARRDGPTEEGAFLDQETDAIFMWMISVYLFTYGKAPAAVLLPGMFRYLFWIPFQYGSMSGVHRIFSGYAKTASAFSTVLLIAAAAPLPAAPPVFWIPAVILLAVSFLWEWIIRTPSGKKRGERNLPAQTAGGAALLLLLVLPGVYFWFPEYSFHRIVRPSLEGAFLFLAAVLLPGVPKKLRKILGAVIGSTGGIIILYSGIEAFLLHIFRQSFYPWSDIPYVENLIGMVTRWAPPEGTAGVILIVSAAAAGFFGILLFTGSYALTGRYPKAAGLTGTVIFAAALLFLPVSPLVTRITAGIIPRHIELQSETDVRRSPAETVDPAYSLPGLKDSPVLLFVAESYGMTVFEKADHRSRLLKRFKIFEKSFNSGGLRTATGILRSPVTGGRSWLAEAELMTGIPVDSQGAYDQLLKEGAYSMPGFFNNNGYHTVFAAPGTTFTTPEWRDLFPFREMYIQGDFGYRGPRLSLADLPDQYLIHFVSRLLDEPREQTPIFIETLLINSHTPFDLVPAYVEDWKTIGDGSVFSGLDHRVFDNRWLTGSEYPEGYTESIGYVLTSLTAFAIDRSDDFGLMIIVGDHQPRLPVRERNTGTGVPVHIITKDKDLLTPWLERHFTPGLIPDEETPVYDMSEFFSMLQNAALRSEEDRKVVPQISPVKE